MIEMPVMQKSASAARGVGRGTRFDRDVRRLLSETRLLPHDDSDRPDAELIAAALAGDGEAFGLIVKRHRPPLLEMARRILGHREEAEDVLQDVFMQIHLHLGGFRGESKLSTWLYTIALNRVRNQLRRRGRRRTVSLDGGPDEEENPAMELPEKSPPVEEVVARRREAARLRQAVEGLPGNFRSIFILHYYQHLPLEEVSRRLVKPLGTVKVYLHRARKLLRAVLTADPVGDPSSAVPETVLSNHGGVVHTHVQEGDLFDMAVPVAFFKAE